MGKDEVRIFKFEFRFEHLAFKFDIPAKSKDEAVFLVKKCLTTILADLNMQFPIIQEDPNSKK